ncbi:MAG: hypothetical protein Q7T03_05530 [Deltaproteobacteria bacterium]|nr:hypothetical protein [Deltaproteobacteria bacterium]
MAKIKICKEKGCHNSQTTDGFCRLHYLRNWKKIQTEKRKKAAKNLNRYVESILQRHPDRYVEEIKKEIRSKDFGKRVDEKFGADEEPVAVFEPNASDEDLDKILSELKIEKGF